MTKAMMRTRLTALLLLLASGGAGAVTVADDLGSRVTLTQPARRIVSLAPHATELLFAAGAGGQVVGVAAYSDWPPAARAIAQVGGYQALDFERILALRPDLVVAWHSGNGAATLERLRALGLTVYASEPRRLDEVPVAIEHLGRLAGTDEAAAQAAAAFRARHARLAERYGSRPPVTVFYQIWHQPLMTVTGAHLISDVLALCGGRNVFAGLPGLSPTIDREAVLAADPQAIIASGMDAARPEWLDEWRRWSQLTAVRRGQLYFVPPDWVQRPTPRTLDAAESICGDLEQARGGGAQPP